MAGSSVEEAGVGRSLDSVSNMRQSSQSSEALAEWRSSEQVENGTPSTSPPYWDSEDGDDSGPKPCDLFGKYTWKIDKFSQINKRELRSNAFEVGSYKWYILIYPQGCDVCNHLSLFLCVANHDKLLPGWSHFAQFTIAVVNKDPKKSKYSDTLHRFWKKEHDWGWKKFMELSKVLDGFIDADTLIIKAQVQVIRERADRPFRCLDRQYRRELIRVYLTNVEQICRRFVEERRSKLGKLIEDKARWSSFCDFWLGMDPSTKRRMSREKTESILKVVVKNFFIEKEVTSTLVMDSLYSGLKALDGQAKSKNNKGKLNGTEEISTPVISMDNDMFVLVDDVLLLLERVSVEPLPPKDEKGPQNRTKDGSSGEDFNKDSVERDERRLTELGRRTIETFVLSHIFSKIEVAYQDAVSLKRQEELIREEAASWLAASEHKSKRGVTEKQKKSKKKQGKNKQNNRKIKDKGRLDKSSLTMEDNIELSSPIREREEYLTEESLVVNAKANAAGDVSDLSDSIDCVSEVQPESEREASPVSFATDTSELNSPVASYRSRVITPSVMDDSSSTCSTDSVPSVVMSGNSRGESKNQKSVSRGRKQRAKAASGKLELARKTSNGSSEPMSGLGSINPSKSCKAAASGSQAISSSLNESSTILEQHPTKGGEDQQKRNAEVEAVNGRTSQEKSVPPSPRSHLQEKSVPHSPRSHPEEKSVPPSPRSHPQEKSVSPSPRSHSHQKSVQPSSRSPSQEESVTPSPRSPSHKKSVPPSPRSPSQEESVPPSPRSPSHKKSVPPSPRGPSQEKSVPPSPRSLSKDPVSSPPMSKRKTSAAVDPVHARKQVSESLKQDTESAPPTSSSETGNLVNRSVPLKLPEKPSALGMPAATEATKMASASQVPAATRKWESLQLPVMSSSLSAPVPRPASPVASMVKSTPLLSRSVSAVGRLSLEPSSTSQSYRPQSYHHAMMGNHGVGTSSVYPQPQSRSSTASSLHSYSQSPAILPECSERMGLNSIRSSFSFGTRSHDLLVNGTQWTDNYPSNSGRSIPSDRHSLFSDIRNFDNHTSHSGQILPPDRPALHGEGRNFDAYSPVHFRSQDNLPSEFPACTPGYQSNAVMTDEFPHLGIINDLLADDIGIDIGASTSSNFQSVSNGSQHLNRQFSYPGEISMLNGLDPSASPYRFQRTQSHLGDGYPREYGFLGGEISNSNPQPFTNGRTNGMVPDQWRMAGSDDLSILSSRGSENDGYSYPHIPDYLNLAGGSNGYGVYRPSSGS